MLSARDELLRESQTELATARQAYREGRNGRDRDALARALGVSDPDLRGIRSPVGWSWNQAAEFFVRMRTSKAEAGQQALLRLPQPRHIVDAAIVEAAKRGISVQEYAPALFQVIICPVDEKLAVEVIAEIMGVTQRRAAECLRPLLRAQGLAHLVPRERAFRRRMPRSA